MTRLDRRDAARRWATAQPVLAGISSVARLRDWTAAGCDRERAREVIAALVRLASLDGPHDQGAALLLVHLLRPAIMKRARSARTDTDETIRVLVAELALVIHTFPWRRTNPTPSRLVWDAWHQAWAGGLSQIATDRAHIAGTVDIELILTDPGQATNASVELVDLLVDAARIGVLTKADAALLWHLAEHGGHGNDAAGKTAAALGIGASTVRRRRAKAIKALVAHNQKTLPVG